MKQGKKVELSGFGQKANVTVPITDAGLFSKPVAELDSYGGIKYTVENSDDDTAAGTAFRNLLQKVYSNKNVYEHNLEVVKNQLRGADPGENKFPKQAELDEALKEKKRLDDEYPMAGGIGGGFSVNPIGFFVVQDKKYKLIPTDKTSMYTELLKNASMVVKKIVEEKTDEKK